MGYQRTGEPSGWLVTECTLDGQSGRPQATGPSQRCPQQDRFRSRRDPLHGSTTPPACRPHGWGAYLGSGSPPRAASVRTMFYSNQGKHIAPPASMWLGVQREEGSRAPGHAGFRGLRHGERPHVGRRDPDAGLQWKEPRAPTPQVSMEPAPPLGKGKAPEPGPWAPICSELGCPGEQSDPRLVPNAPGV